MKSHRLNCFLLFFLGTAVFQLTAEQSEADRKLLADVRAKAGEGDAQSQFELGIAFFGGSLGVAKDEAEAVRWFRKAAEQNLAKAQYNLGVCYAEGQGVVVDGEAAAKWLHKAADQNLAEALTWLRRAAEQNHAQAESNLGVCYDRGQGVAKDGVEAVKWLRKAAAQNDADAQNVLGTCYYNGEGVAKAQVEAVKWYCSAAEQNDADGQGNPGVCYAVGEGVAKDFVESYKWMLLASAQGNERTKEVVTILENKMTREQIGEGQKLARNFKPRELPTSGGDMSSVGILQTRPEACGTGFFITEDGYLITNQHVAGNGAQVRLVTEAGLISAKVVKVDAANDLALLKVEGKFTPIPVVSSRAVKMGGTVATVGFPNIGLQGFAPKLAKGEIAALSGPDDPRYFQISVPVQPGNSGGALVDERGNVVGVVAAKLNVAAAVATSGALPENVNYAVKSSLLLSFLESVPDVSAKLKEPNTKERKFEDVVKSAEQAAVLVLVY